MLSEELHELLHEPSPLRHAVAQVPAAAGVQPEDVPPVQVAHAAGDRAHARQMAVELRELAPVQRLAVLGVDVHAALPHPVPVDVRVEGRQGGRHDVLRVPPRFPVVRPAERREHGVARGVDERTGGHVAVALDVVQDDPADTSLVGRGVGVDDAREEPHLHPALGRQLIEEQLQPLTAELRPAVVVLPPSVGVHALRHETALVEGLDQLAHEPADQHTLAVGHRVEGVDHAGGAHAAQAARLLDQQHVRPQPGGADGGRAAGRPATRHDEVIRPVHGNIAHQLVRASHPGPLSGLAQSLSVRQDGPS